MGILPAFTTTLLLALASSPLLSEPESALDATVRRGLDFLAKDSLAWKKEHNCASCHHASMMVWAMREAKLHKYAVNESVFNELTLWIAESGDGTTSVARPAGKPKALNTKAVWYALALAADPKPDAMTQQALVRLRQTILRDQVDNGSWVAWPETRPPFFGASDENMTVLAALALATGDGAVKLARDRAVKWLADTKTNNDLQAVALRLVLWKKLDRPKEDWRPLARNLIERQQEDGGWSQAQGMPSDAWATGQALYALAVAGLQPTESAIADGQAFLIKRQRPDGSWPMTSRPTKPGGAGSTSLIPITGGGSAWAVLGLVQSEKAKDRTTPK